MWNSIVSVADHCLFISFAPSLMAHGIFTLLGLLARFQTDTGFSAGPGYL